MRAGHKRRGRRESRALSRARHGRDPRRHDSSASVQCALDRECPTRELRLRIRLAQLTEHELVESGLPFAETRDGRIASGREHSARGSEPGCFLQELLSLTAEWQHEVAFALVALARDPPQVSVKITTVHPRGLIASRGSQQHKPDEQSVGVRCVPSDFWIRKMARNGPNGSQLIVRQNALSSPFLGLCTGHAARDRASEIVSAGSIPVGDPAQDGEHLIG